MQLGYLTSQYGGPSDTFIRQEVRQMRTLGHTVRTFSIRRPGLGQAVNDAVRAEQANTAKYLAAEAGYFAADRAMQTHDGMGYAKEYDVERYWREARLMRIAPVPQEMVLNYIAEHVLGLPRSY